MIRAVLPALSAGIRLGLSTLHILLSDVYFIFCSLIMRCLGGVIVLLFLDILYVVSFKIFDGFIMFRS